MEWNVAVMNAYTPPVGRLYEVIRNKEGLALHYMLLSFSFFFNTYLGTSILAG
jgi:hypothetical protein